MLKILITRADILRQDTKALEEPRIRGPRSVRPASADIIY